MGRALGSISICLCLCPIVVRAWNDMLPPVQFLKPTQVKGLMKPPAPILEILKKPARFDEIKGPDFEHLDRAPLCCKALTAHCVACSKGMRIEDLCRRLPRLPGCSAHDVSGIPDMGVRPAHGVPAVPAVHAMPAVPVMPLQKLVDDVEHYVEKHPGALENATNKALGGLSKMFSHRAKGQRVQATSAPVGSLPAVDGPVAIPAVPVAVEEPAFGRRWVENPWIITGIATATAAVCAGIAVGVLCFARIQRVHIAREPLLASGPMQSSLSDAATAAGEVAA